MTIEEIERVQLATRHEARSTAFEISQVEATSRLAIAVYEVALQLAILNQWGERFALVHDKETPV
jgi:hypothetical protein